MTAVASFAEIRALIPHLPGPDLEAGTAVAHGKGASADLAAWLATWQGKHPPVLEHPRLAVFVGLHGVAKRLGRDSDMVYDLVQSMVGGDAALNQVCQTVDCDLRVYEMSVDRPTPDFTWAPAMSEVECARAMAYGMMAVEPGLDVLCLAGLGDATDASVAAVLAALANDDAANWGPAETAAVANQGAVRAKGDDPLEVLREVGGPELSAIAGAVLAARLARTPVVLEGAAGLAAAAVLHRLDARALGHCVIAQIPPYAAARRLVQELRLRVVNTVEEGPGGAGAALAIPILRAAATGGAG